ncbi:MAG: CD1871A family CXXC motif-containing protein [Clostridiaceae bacterium]
MKRALPYLLLGAGVLFLVLGIFGDEIKIVLSRAANICLECIGIG